MTVQSEVIRKVHDCNGTTGPFLTPPFTSDGDLVATLTLIADGTETALVLTTDYTLTGAGDPAGGELTLAAAKSSSYKITILNDPPATQEVDYGVNDPFPAASHESALDKLTRLVQRVRDRMGRTLRLSDGDVSGAEVVIPTPQAGSIFGWDATATRLVNIALQVGTSLADLASSAGASFIGFIQGMPGAVRRSLQDLFRESVRITDFAGVDPTGVTDSTDGIHAAWAAVPDGTAIKYNGIFKVTALVHPDKVIMHRGVSNRKTRIQGSGAKVIAFPYRPNQNSQGSTISNIWIQGDGNPDNSVDGTNTALDIDNFGVHLDNVFCSHAAYGVDAHTMVGTNWKNVIGYGKTRGIRFSPPAVVTDPSNQGFIYECHFDRIQASTSTTGAGLEVAAGLEFAGNVIDVLSSESCGHGVLMLGSDASGIGNIINQPWVERIQAGGYWYHDTMPANVYFAPHWRPADAAVNDWGSALHQTASGMHKPTFGQTLTLGALLHPSGGVYRFNGTESYSNEMHAIFQRWWPTNSTLADGSSYFATSDAQSKDGVVIASNGAVSGTVDVANVVCIPGDTSVLHLHVRFAASSTASGSGWGVYERALRWNIDNSFDNGPGNVINTDSTNGCTLVLTNVGGATRTVKVSCTLAAGNYRLDTEIKAFCGVSGNGARGVSIVPLI